MARSKFSILLFWLAVLLSTVLVGCGDSPQAPETEDPEDEDPLAGAVVCLSDSTCALEGVCDTSSAINITNCGNSTVLSWSVGADSAWISLSVASGETPGEFFIMADSNLSGAVRTATVTVTATGLTDSTVTLAVSQLIPETEPSQAELSVSITAWDATSLGETSPEITVTNIGDALSFDWAVATDETWLTLSETGGSIPGSFTITANPNETGSSRSGVVTVTAEGITGSPWEIAVEQICIVGLVGAYDTPGNANSVSVSGDYAYVAASGSGLVVIDVSVPSGPSLAGSYDTPGYASGVFVSGDYAYVADAESGLQIINISNPSSPALAGDYNTPDYAYDVFVLGDYAYVADGESGLVVVNVSDPSSPSLAGSYDTQASAQGVFVVGNYAYISDFWGGLVILDVSAPSSPTLAGSYNTPGYAYAAFVDGDYAYVADEYKGCQLIDVSDPSVPSLVTNVDTEWALDVFVSGEYVFVADFDGGLLILNVGLSTL